LIENAIFRAAVLSVAIAGLPAPLQADPLACAGGQILIEGAGADAPLICGLADRVRAQLATCNLTVPEPLSIAIVPELAENCVGLYHCGENRIDLLPPAEYAELQAAGDLEAFQPISPEAIFESLMRHEMAHAALADTPCPYDSCLVTQEYVAYTMQIRFLPEGDRATYTAEAPGPGTVGPDMLHPIILMMAPDLFAHRAWRHLLDQDEPCEFIGRIARGEITLDIPQW
jgi:hypothetical protein